MDTWLLFFLIHTVLLLLVGSCHCNMYDQAMSYSSGYAVPTVYTYPYPYSGAYYGQRILPMAPVSQTYGYPIVRSAALYPADGYMRRTSTVEDDIGDDRQRIQAANEPYKISLMTDNVQQMMNNGQKEVLSMMSAGAEDAPRFARILVKQRRSAQDAGVQATPDVLSRGLETLSSWYRDAVPTSAAPTAYSGAASDTFSRGIDTMSTWHRDAKPTPTAASTYYTQGSLYPNLSSAPPQYTQQQQQPAMNYYHSGMMTNNPMYPNPQSYGNNMNYPTSYYSPQQFPSTRQSSPSFVDTVITALPEIRKLTRVVAPYVMGSGGPSARTARQSAEYMLGASNPIVSPYITKKQNLEQKQTTSNGDGKPTMVQQVQRHVLDGDMSYGDSGDQMVRSSWSPYLGDNTDAQSSSNAYPYGYYEPDARTTDDSATFRDSGLGYDDQSYMVGDDNTMSYADEADLYRQLYSQYYSLL